MGAEVIKVETAARADPGRASELHQVLGQSKLGLALDLKRPEAMLVARRLVAKSDVVVENFATGVMDRLGLGYQDVRQLAPRAVMLSASGMGRTGPDADKVAYGTLIQCFTGFAAGNGYAGLPPSVGMAWADPVCGLLMAFGVVAALERRRRTGAGCHIDFSMVEALLSTMPGPIVGHQLGLKTAHRQGNRSPEHLLHDAFRSAGDDRWLAVAVRGREELSRLARFLGCGDALAEVERALAGWCGSQTAEEAEEALAAADVAAAASADAADLFADHHLASRGFYVPLTVSDGATRWLPRLPWRIDSGMAERGFRPAPQIGEHSGQVLAEVLGMSAKEIDALRASGALS
jgi:crotonobetainyl-CoA:carnitine CoA-transferase CaiB-like acyl-CoA transferase